MAAPTASKPSREVRLVAVSPEGISPHYTGQYNLEACHEYLTEQLEEDREAIPSVAELAE
jgi:hypothetical protein